MSVTLYNLQNGASDLSMASIENFRQHTVVDIVCGIIGAVASRVLGVISLIYGAPSLIKVPAKMASAFSTIIHDEISARSVLRIAIALSTIPLLPFVRAGVSALGVISPEITYQVLNLHQHLLWLGLFSKAQLHAFPMKADDLIDRIGDQHLRMELVRRALRRLLLEEALQSHSHTNASPFSTRIWGKAAKEAIGEDPEERRMREEPPVRVQEIITTADGTTPPILQAFMDQLSHSMRASILRFSKEGLYSKEDIEDGITALPAAVMTGLLDVIQNHCTYAHGEILFQNQALTKERAGDLAQKKNLLNVILQMYKRLPYNEKKDAFYYLCCDDDRVRTHQNLPDKSGKMQAFFLKMGELRTPFIDESLPLLKGKFSGIFVLPDHYGTTAR